MSVVRLYDRWAPRYDRDRPLWARWVGGEAETFLEGVILPRYLPSEREAIMLDLGCGTAINLERLKRLDLRVREYVGLDLSLGMLAQARSEWGDRGESLFCRGDACRLPFLDATFDLVLSTWLLSHIAQPSEAVEEALRVLKAGGHLVVLFWSRPRFPWGLPMWFAERVFQMRSLRPEEVEGFPGQIVRRQFASEAITLMAWHKR